MKKLCSLMMIFCLIIGLCACGGKLQIDGSSTLRGVNAVVESCRVEQQKTGLTAVTAGITLTNGSESGIMGVKYDLILLDKAGEELYRFENLRYTVEAVPVPVGSSVKIEATPRYRIEGKPAAVRIELRELITEEDMPPVHVPQIGETLGEALDNEHLRNILSDLPTSIEIRIDRSGTESSATITDAGTIERFATLLSQLTIAAESQEFVTDNYNGLTLSFADGESVNLSLNLKNLECRIYDTLRLYELGGFDRVWQLMQELSE